jgi:hypothetical protein
MTVPKGDDEEVDVSHIVVVRIKSFPVQRGRYLLFMTHFKMMTFHMSDTG